MKRMVITSLAALVIMGGVGLNFAGAQFGGLGQPPPRSRPTVSPLINQGAGGINAFNYYGIIKPQFDTNRSINQLQQGLQLLNPDGSLQGALSQGQPNALGGMQTGHSATFFNYSHYYPMGGTSTGSTSGVGATGAGFGAGATGNRTFYGATMNNFVR